MNEALCLLRRACFHEMLVPDYILSLPEASPLTGRAACPNYSSAYMGLCRHPALHISRRIDFYNLIGSCKLEHVVSKLKDPAFQNKRIVIVVGTDLESVVTHRCLQSHSIPHLFHKISTNPALSLLSTQETMIAFNDPNREKFCSAIAVVQDIVFSYPYIAPTQVDIMYVLSGSWATCLNVKRSLRGDGTLLRVVASETLEELLERKGGSFLHLQGYKIPDARPPSVGRVPATFFFDSTKLLSTAPAMLEYLKELATPPMQFGLGKGKGCFLSGFQSISMTTDKDDVDTQAPIIQWISRFYYDLENAEKKLNSRFDAESPLNVPILSLRQLSNDLNMLSLNRYAAIISYKTFRNYSFLLDPVRNEYISDSSLRNRCQSRVSVQQERMSYLIYDKVFHQSSVAEDFAHNLHILCKNGILVDSNLYVSPLFLSSQKNEFLIPPSKSRFSHEFALQYLYQPLPPAIKPQPKKSRSSNNPNAAPSKRKNPNPVEKANKKAAIAAPEVANAIPQPSVLSFDDFGKNSYQDLCIMIA